MRQAVGIDLGGTELRAALVTEDGAVTAHVQTRTAAAAGPDVVIGQMIDLIDRLRRSGGWAAPVGIGIGSPGPLDAAAGLVLAPPTLAGWQDVPLAAIVAGRSGLDVVLDNDGHAAALGEWVFGAARGLQHFVYVTVSTGIGGGIVCDGQLLRGLGGRAGHVGHMIVTEADVPCACGNRGCWEALASGSALGRAAQAAVQAAPGGLMAELARAGGGGVDARIVGLAARRGDPAALGLIAREAELLGAGIVSLMHLYSPERVVLGGGMSALFDLLHPTIATVIAARAMPAFRGVPVVRAALGDRTGVIGAAALQLSPRGRPLPAAAIPAPGPPAIPAPHPSLPSASAARRAALDP